MSELTITESLAEIRTIDARVQKKHEVIIANIARQDGLRDPFEKDGGTKSVIAREWQSIGDLLERKVRLRAAIQNANNSTEVTINGATKTIADWLVWRREAAPLLKNLAQTQWNTIQSIRNDAQRKGLAVVTTGDLANKSTDIIVNVDERRLAEYREHIEETLGVLDGQLSLKNATVKISV